MWVAISPYFDEGVERHTPSITKGDDEFWVIYAGSLARSYDVATLIRACELAEPSLPEELGKRLSLYILGDGPNRPGLEKLAEDIDAPAVFTGYVDYQIMAAHLKASDVLVNSLIKGAPQSIVSKIADYLCAGRPIINTAKARNSRTSARRTALA